MFSLALAACSSSPVSTGLRQPAKTLSLTRDQILQSAVADENIVRETKHATRFYDHGFRTKKTVLVMHGLHESPAYMQGFSQHFFDQGYNVISLRLPGHMTKDQNDLNQVKAEEWIEAAENAFAEAQVLGEQIEILGYSTGGTLAVYLALKYPQQVKALYLVSPALALRNRVFLAGTVLGWTNLDLSKLCQAEKRERMLCRMILHSDEQLRQMLDEGLQSSPAAGLQVQRLIDLISPRTDLREDNRLYYPRLRETYGKLNVPLAMINSESDMVIQPDFNQELMAKYQAPHVSLMFPKSAKISHLMMNKSKQDAFTRSPETENPQFSKIIEKIDELRSKLEN